jgi:hypothetical protein
LIEPAERAQVLCQLAIGLPLPEPEIDDFGMLNDQSIKRLDGSLVFLRRALDSVRASQPECDAQAEVADVRLIL